MNPPIAAQLADARTPAELAEALSARGIPVHTWGRGAAKTVAHLHAELAGGECTLHDGIAGSLDRRVRVCQVTVTHGGRVLVEDHQRFRDGRVRRRALPGSVSEKLTAAEDPAAGARRALAEELGVDPEGLELVAGRHGIAFGPSPSYPGLAGVYQTLCFRVELPAELYDPAGYVETQADKQTVFCWQPADG